ncbi:hypothetical protein [Bacillus sp. FSL K6-0067]|uniref:hypothetical protein n=1 Tax=Bacillus sp. FSL K6-0067 TaxID=2921412 RepID=UPI000A4F09EB|nr:hypothetical protein [Bacillus cereus]
MDNLFDDGEQVRVKSTGEIVTIENWWCALNNPAFGFQYNIVGQPSSWYAEHELEKIS